MSWRAERSSKPRDWRQLMAKKRSARTSGLDEMLTDYMADHGLLAKSREMLAAFVWAEVVGQWYAQHTQVTQIRDGVLMVHCDSAPRAQQLQLDSDYIKEKLNKRLDGSFIKEIRATSGRVGRGRPAPTIAETEEEPLPSPAELAQLRVPQQDVDFIRALAEKTGDEGLQRQFTAAMTNFCRLQQWRRAQGYQPCPGCGRLVASDQRCPVCHPGRIPQQGNPDFDESYDNYRGG